MGSVAVLKMDASVGPAGQVEPKRVHPFFAPNQLPMAPEQNQNANPSESAAEPSHTFAHEHAPKKANEASEDDSLEKKSGRKTKRRKVETSAEEDVSDGKTTAKKRATRRSKGGSSGTDITAHFSKLDKDNIDSAPTTTKVTHPFFLGKAKPTPVKPTDAVTETKSKTDAPAAPKVTQFTSTPCSPKKPRATAASLMPRIGTKHAGLKFPGAMLPAWPWKDAIHIRGGEPLPIPAIGSSYSLRKSKGHAVNIPTNESLMDRVTQGMEIKDTREAVLNMNGDDFAPAPPQLRLPQKHFESGSKLQHRVLSELSCSRSPARSLETKQRQKIKGHSSLGSSNGNEEGKLPPQIAPLFHSIKTGLSAFDRSQCETAMWTQKYAPGSATEVLQPGREVFMLRDWLQALVVQSVHTGSAEGEKSKKGKSGAPKKKKKKKVDDFIVSSGEEDNEMNEVSDGEADWSPSGCQGVVKKTVVRSGDLAGRGSKEGTRATNVVVISGPHGSGKTAAVYAVAKELDFEIFEINSSSRRSGKDIMEKIGDMTTNHLVQQQQTGESEQPAAAPQEDETEKDIKSGKQATMNAFFKAKPAVAAKPKETVKPAPPKPAKDVKKEPAKNQKQSLILLDEADILYDKDQQFWSTVLTLAAQSKRPFVITCNDETLLPLQSLTLHAIMRFSPPPVHLAVDRLLLIAANEGHALKRQAVEALYESRNRDLRAATTDLNYWCQMGIGDRRGGFEWFYPRWPKGVDLDENKEVVRVVSEDTYQLGMSWLGRDSIVDSTISPAAVEEELLSQAWASWQLDPEHWHDTDGIADWANSLSAASTSPTDRLQVLKSYDELADAMSVADLCSLGAFGLFKQESIDATLPPLSDKSREDFICGLRPLDTPLLTRYDSLTTSLSGTIKSLSRASLQKSTRTPGNPPTPALQPLKEFQVLDSIQTRFTATPRYTPAIARIDFAFAFDPIAAADTSAAAPVSYLDPSVFDRTLKLIVLDVAPFVRGIVAYDVSLQKQRQKLSNVLSDGGRNAQGKKRMRTTRAALSALEGGSRSTTRGERWFKAEINPFYVSRTAGDGWEKFAMDGIASPPDSPARSEESSHPPSSPVSKGRKRKVRATVVEEESGDELA